MRSPAVVLVIVSLTASLLGVSCRDADRQPSGPPAEPSAGQWRAWVLSSGGEVRVPPPPLHGSAAARRDQKGLDVAMRRRTEADVRAVREFGAVPPVGPWLERAMAFVAQRAKDPPAASRAYALLSVAMHDATIAAWHWKYRYRRKPPVAKLLVPRGSDPSYPSEHAAIAGAASRVLEYAFPEQPAARLEEDAQDAARSRVLAGTSFLSDVTAGLRLGRSVADRVIGRAKRDGFTRKWDGRRPRGIGYWAPPPGSAARPVEPLAGSWRTWVLNTGSQFRPPRPPRLDSPEMRAEARKLMRVRDGLTRRQKRIARFWQGGEGTALPPGIWNQVMIPYVRKRRLSTPAATRVFALLNVAMADAGVAAWDAKYAYWFPRPENGIRDLGLDRSWEPYLPTPFFPSFVSGHSTYSSAAGEVLAHLFPDDARTWRARAREAGISRIYAGIHWPVDNRAGARMGRAIGRLVVRRATEDGAER